MVEVSRKATSIKIDIQLWKEFKKYCIDKEIFLSDLLEDLIRREIKK